MFQVKSSWKLILVQMILAPCWYPGFPSILVYFCVSVFPEELGALLFYRTQNLSVFKHLAVARKQSQRLDVQWRLIALGRWCSRESVCISMMRIMRRSEPCQQMHWLAFRMTSLFCDCSIITFATFRYVLSGDHPERLTPIAILGIFCMSTKELR